MAAVKFSLLAFAFLIIAALSSGPVQANALAANRAQVARHAHDAVAKRRRDEPSPSPTCRPSPPSSSTPAPASTTPTPSSTTPAAPSPTSADSKKYCFAWGDDYPLENFLGLSRVEYLYNWNPILPDNLYGLKGIPMLWGNKTQMITDFQNTVKEGYASYVAGPNEPNEPSQANLSALDCFNLWMQYINPLAGQGYTLISPACTDDQLGLDWYKEFFKYCDQSTVPCHVDIVAFHAYTTNAQDLITYAQKLHDAYGRPVAITEAADQNFSGIGGQPQMLDVWAFAKQVVSFVDSTQWLVAYCPYAMVNDMGSVDANNTLIDPATGELTPLGWYYFDH